MTITQDPSAPLVAVVGATGVQGGSVVKALAASHRLYRELEKAHVEVVALEIALQNADAVRTIYVAFLGLFVLRALEAEEFPAGTDVCTNSEDITMGEMVQQLADCTSRTPLPINI
ncbi:hypothetical protein C8J57DRAFT_1505493 [Mycena rebaudengoi]|nr:hypothetical protein C8J57DRAFT_1517434 [Mycena rebaudengoi]KAJ7274733.1 hypothetical protein C8J57DRAFT_1505493 [Mycena rebaudengoi]